MEYKRFIDLSDIDYKSILLFGPRQTGKSYFLKKHFPKNLTYNLLLSDIFLKFSTKPSLFREEILAHLQLDPIEDPIIVDEIQRIPELLNEVHYLIEEKGLKFILTGSSARKLKRGGANLLAGRALQKRLYPLSTKEIGEDFNLERILQYGSLPAIYQSKIPEKELRSYVGTYLNEEIRAEGLVRKLDPFSRFLEIAAMVNSEVLNFSNIASDLGLSSKTVKEYFLILEDTLVGQMLRPYQKTEKRKAISSPKFYFFDLGVVNILADKGKIQPKSEAFGKALEHFVYTEIRTYLEYNNDHRKLRFWRSKNRQEVDFVVGDDTAIEVKASKQVGKRHLKGLKALAEEVPLKNKIIVCMEENSRLVNEKYLILPIKDFLKQLWAGKF